MYEEQKNFIHKFYSNIYLVNRYAFPGCLATGPFLDGACIDLAAVALGYKPACIIEGDINLPINDYFITLCYHRNKVLLDLSEIRNCGNVYIVCDPDRVNDFKNIEWFSGKESADIVLGELLGIPKHLIDLFIECYKNSEIPDWNYYNNKADIIAQEIYFSS
jgi:hypothetical protein